MLFKDNSHWLQRCKRVCEQENRKIGKSETQGETWIRIGRIITVSFSSDAYVPFKTRLRHSQIAAEEPTSHTTSSVTIR